MEDEYNKKDIERRINIIKGQLDGLAKMINEEAYCIDVLDLSYAIQNSLKSVDVVVLERHLQIHVSEQFSNQKDKAIKELIEIYKKRQRSS